MNVPQLDPDRSRIPAGNGALTTAAEILDPLKAIPEEEVCLGSSICERMRRTHPDALAEIIRNSGKPRATPHTRRPRRSTPPPSKTA